MSPEMIAAILGLGLMCATVAIILYKKLPKRLKPKKYVKQWRGLQQLCKNKDTWRDAVIAADKLLDKALRQRKFKGSSPGERLVSAQRKFTNNDEVWTAHNLYKKLIANSELRPNEEETKRALTSFRQALRDVGALPHERND